MEVPGGSRAEVRAAYDAIAEEYAAAFPTTEPEAAVDLAMVELLVRVVREGGGPTCSTPAAAPAGWPVSSLTVGARWSGSTSPRGCSHDVGARLRERGHDVALTRWHRGPRELIALLGGAGFERVARLVREPLGREREGQVFVLARLASREHR